MNKVFWYANYSSVSPITLSDRSLDGICYYDQNTLGVYYLGSDIFNTELEAYDYVARHIQQDIDVEQEEVDRLRDILHELEHRIEELTK